MNKPSKFCSGSLSATGPPCASGSHTAQFGKSAGKAPYVLHIDSGPKVMGPADLEASS